ncbi:MAG: methyltransferase [Methylobacteriaceae bacterium]|nr:methyltransferase [Methylobacteriaceae bacterium]
MDEGGLTTDAFLAGALRLQQPAAGHRAGTDAVLLAAAIPANARGLAVDAGAGVGAAGLATALAAPELRVALLEREPALAALAHANIEINRLIDRAFVAEADLLSAESYIGAGLARGSADFVLTNPPFFSSEKIRVSPDRNKAAAHVIGAGGIGAWVKACLALLKPSGTFLIIHRADALAEILRALSSSAGALIVLPIHPRADRPATRILVRGLKGRRTPPVLAPPLILHDGDGTFAPFAAALHRGSARIDWDKLSCSKVAPG